jgi:hypothetical protein
MLISENIVQALVKRDHDFRILIIYSRRNIIEDHYERVYHDLVNWYGHEDAVIRETKYELRTRTNFVVEFDISSRYIGYGDRYDLILDCCSEHRRHDSRQLATRLNKDHHHLYIFVKEALPPPADRITVSWI